MDQVTNVQDAQNQPNIGLELSNRQKVAEILAQLLADHHILYIKLRNYHWNVEGMHFHSLHELFEDIYKDVAGNIDDIAERIRMLGFYAPGSMEEFKETARLSETDHLNGNDKQMLQHILADLEMLIQVLRNNVTETIDEYGDAGNSDFLTGLMQEHEKAAWMIRAHLS